MLVAPRPCWAPFGLSFLGGVSRARVCVRVCAVCLRVGVRARACACVSVRPVCTRVMQLRATRAKNSVSGDLVCFMYTHWGHLSAKTRHRHNNRLFAAGMHFCVKAFAGGGRHPPLRLGTPRDFIDPWVFCFPRRGRFPGVSVTGVD